MNWKLVLGLLALVATASAVPLGPYSIDYDLEDAIWTPIAKNDGIGADNLTTTAYAGVLLAPDGWALIIINDFNREIGLDSYDCWGMMSNVTEFIPVENLQSAVANDGQNWRAVWSLDGGWEDEILYGSESAAVTTGGWDREEVESFLGSLKVTKSAP